MPEQLSGKTVQLRRRRKRCGHQGDDGIVQECLEAKEPFFKWWGSQFEEGALKLIGVESFKALVEKGERNIPVLKDGEAIMAQGTTTCAAASVSHA